MNWNALAFLGEPWFVIPWYAVGVLSAAWMVWDVRHANRHLDTALKLAWPIIIVFFSVAGLLLYLASSRPPNAGGAENEREELRCFREYSESTMRKVTAAVTHCVGGDGLGIISAMVIARISGMSFREEYWFEYAVGYAFGWFIFQYIAMRAMTNSAAKALWMGGRGEFFSMLTVMAGMGVVMGVVTPLVMGEQPKPDTFAFWGFAALGLMAGFVVTFPMNWLLVAAEWKHGIGVHAKQKLKKLEQGT